MNSNYPSSSQAIRNLADLRLAYQTVHTDGLFRILQFDQPYVQGSEFWVVSEKGFLWEPIDSLNAGLEYLESEEAKEYQSAQPHELRVQ